MSVGSLASWPLGFIASVGHWLGLREIWTPKLVPAMPLGAMESHVPFLCVSSQAGHNFYNADMSYVKKLCGTFLGGPKLPER